VLNLPKSRWGKTPRSKKNSYLNARVGQRTRGNNNNYSASGAIVGYLAVYIAWP